MNEDMYDEGSELYQIVETTKGRNGYPEGLGKAVIGFDCFGEAEEFANRNKGKIVVLHRRDGWQLWEVTGLAYEPFDLSADDFGNDFTDWTYEQRYEWWESERFFIKDSVDDMSPEEFIDWAARVNEIWEKFDEVCDGEILLLNEGRYDSIVRKHTMRHYKDTHTYVIGVVDRDDL